MEWNLGTCHDILHSGVVCDGLLSVNKGIQGGKSPIASPTVTILSVLNDGNISV